MTRSHSLVGLGCMLAAWLVASYAHAQTRFTPAIWIDPDGCEHWVIDDGAEGYMSPHLRRDGTPVCHTKNLCGVIETDVLFEFDSAKLTPEGRARVTKVVQGSPARAYVVTGHTDNKGSDEYNLRLSADRAQAVAAHVRSLGVSISDVGAYGERKPVASNATEEGRTQNRRVEVICLN